MVIYLPELSASDTRFPAVERALAEPDGLLAMGGDLSVERLLSAYNNGIFPWFNDDDPLLWWSPSIRAVFAPHTLKPNRSLLKVLRRGRFTFSVNCAFSQVIAHCAAPRNKQSGTWISAQMQQAYLLLHQQGHAHSVEVWQQEKLVGGLYGLQIGALFCGESMFNLQPDTAKLALVMLQHHLQTATAGWIDCQMPNPFLLQLGASKMSRQDYLQLLQQQAVQSPHRELWRARTLSSEFRDV